MSVMVFSAPAPAESSRHGYAGEEIDRQHGRRERGRRYQPSIGLLPFLPQLLSGLPLAPFHAMLCLDATRRGHAHAQGMLILMEGTCS